MIIEMSVNDKLCPKQTLMAAGKREYESKHMGLSGQEIGKGE